MTANCFRSGSISEMTLFLHCVKTHSFTGYLQMPRTLLTVYVPENIMLLLSFLKHSAKDMMSLFSSETTHPTITYCINEKENAIAPKVTEKGADAIRQEINETFTETISKTALDAFRLLLTFPQKKGMHLLQKIYLLRLQKSLPILILLPELYRLFLI